MVLNLYKAVITELISDREKKTTLKQDLELLNSKDCNGQLRFCVVYRSERKKILYN